MTTNEFAHGPSTIRLGDLEVSRLGYGAMRLPGKDVWGEPEDPERARRVLRRAIDLGVRLIDTAWYYGPFVSNRLIAEALHPYPKDLVLATKLGGKRLPDRSWAPASRPEELRKGCEDDLRSLKLDRVDVVHLRHFPSEVPFAESLDAMIQLQREGKIRHLGLSNVSLALVEQALAKTPIVSVSNLFNIGGGRGQLAKMTHSEVDEPAKVLELCAARGIAFLPYFPLAVGRIGGTHAAVAEVARRHQATPAQVGLAWLLARSPAILPIPGTGSPEHLEENWAARKLALTPEDLRALAVA